MTEHNPAAEIRLPREEKRLPRHALLVSEVKAVLELPDLGTPVGLRNRSLLETLYSTGLRRAEVSALGLADLDRERGVLLVPTIIACDRVPMGDAEYHYQPLSIGPELPPLPAR